MHVYSSRVRDCVRAFQRCGASLIVVRSRATSGITSCAGGWCRQTCTCARLQLACAGLCVCVPSSVMRASWIVVRSRDGAAQSRTRELTHTHTHTHAHGLFAKHIKNGFLVSFDTLLSTVALPPCLPPHSPLFLPRVRVSQSLDTSFAHTHAVVESSS